MRRYDPARNPVARAYREYTGGKDRMSWDQTAALFAVRGLAHDGQTYFTAVTEGHNRFELTVGPPGGQGPQASRNVWVAAPDSEQAYLVAAMPPAQLARVIEDLMIACVSGRLPPVQRTFFTGAAADGDPVLPFSLSPFARAGDAAAAAATATAGALARKLLRFDFAIFASPAAGADPDHPGILYPPTLRHPGQRVSLKITSMSSS